MLVKVEIGNKLSRLNHRMLPFCTALLRRTSLLLRMVEGLNASTDPAHSSAKIPLGAGIQAQQAGQNYHGEYTRHQSLRLTLVIRKYFLLLGEGNTELQNSSIQLETLMLESEGD